MSDLKVINAIRNKIKKYNKNNDVKKVLNELLEELSNDYHGLCKEKNIKSTTSTDLTDANKLNKTYNLYLKNKNYSVSNKLCLCKEIRKNNKMSFSEASNALKQDKILILENASYVEVLKKQEDLKKIGIDSYFGIKDRDKDKDIVDDISSYYIDLSSSYKDEIFYDIAVKTNSLDDHQISFIISLLRRRMGYNDAYKYINKNNEIIVLELIENNSINMYKDLFKSKNIQFRLIQL